MQAVILAGGLGTRLRPLTFSVPKALVLVHGKPFLRYQVELLESFGITDVSLLVSHLGAQIYYMGSFPVVFPAKFGKPEAERVTRVEILDSGTLERAARKIMTLYA